MPKEKSPLSAEELLAHATKTLATPAPPLKFPVPTAEQIARLAALEKQLVDREIKNGYRDPLAMQILVLRAEING